MTPPPWVQESTFLSLPSTFLFHVVLLFFVFVVVFISFSAFNKRRRRKKYNLPPGPLRLPLIGNLHHLLGSMPHVSLAKLAAKYGPIYSLTLGRIPTVVVSSPPLAREVLRTHDLHFASRPRLLAAEVLFYNSPNVAYAPYGDYWRIIRKICITELLSVRRIDSFASFRSAEVERMIDRVSSAASPALIDITQVLALYASGVVCRSAFGSDYSESGDYDRHDFHRLLHHFQVLLGGFLLADFYPSMEWVTKITGTHHQMWDTRRRFDTIIDEMIANRMELRRQLQISKNNMECRTKDLLDVMLDLQQSEDKGISLTIDNIKSNILVLFAGGTDTTFATLDWAMTEMIMWPKTMKMAQEEIDRVVGNGKGVSESDIHKMEYLKAIVKETLRLHPPAPLLVPHLGREDVVISGYDIPAKTRVYVNAWAIGRDPDLWEDPKTFKPERFLGSTMDYKGQDFQLIPFGSGRRMCPGIIFGIMIVELALAQLLHSFDWELPPGTKPGDLDLSEFFGLTVNKKCHLKLVATPRNQTRRHSLI